MSQKMERFPSPDSWRPPEMVPRLQPIQRRTDTVTTIRKAFTALMLVGVVPNAWVLNPVDIEQLELTRENGTGGGFLLDQADSLGRVTKVSVVPSVAVPAGQALLGDWSTAKLVDR